MGLMDNLKKGFDKAREGASDLAQTAKLKMEIGKLNDRRKEVFRRIGEQVYAAANAGDAAVGFDAEVEELRSVDQQIAAKEAEIERVKTEEGSGGSPSS